MELLKRGASDYLGDALPCNLSWLCRVLSLEGFLLRWVNLGGASERADDGNRISSIGRHRGRTEVWDKQPVSCYALTSITSRSMKKKMNALQGGVVAPIAVGVSTLFHPILSASTKTVDEIQTGSSK